MTMCERVAVLETLFRYAIYFDEGRFEEMASLFVDTATFEINQQVGDMPSRMDGRAAIIGALSTRRSGSSAIQRRHCVTNPVVAFPADRVATVQSYILVTATDSGRGDALLATVGTYRDTLALDGDMWRFTARHLMLDAPMRLAATRS